MPIYEYQCTKCGEIFEVVQRITDDPLTECKFCKATVEKLFSQSSFQLKGSGWYLTDYARKSSSPATEKPKSSDSSAETKSSSETKSTEKSTESKT